MEKLKLEHLAPYLPYGIGIKYNNGEISTLTQELMRDTAGFLNSLINVFKPILRPLSTIDLEFFKDNIDESIEDFRINCEPENNHLSVEVCDIILGWSALSFEEYQLFFKHHFDVFGLIDKGLAIYINTI